MQLRAPGPRVSVVGAQSAPRTTAGPELTYMRSRAIPEQFSSPARDGPRLRFWFSTLRMYSLSAGVSARPWIKHLTFTIEKHLCIERPWTAKKKRKGRSANETEITDKTDDPPNAKVPRKVRRGTLSSKGKFRGSTLSEAFEAATPATPATSTHAAPWHPCHPLGPEAWTSLIRMGFNFCGPLSPSLTSGVRLP